MFSSNLRKDLLVTALEGGSNYWYYIPDVIKIEDLPFSECVWAAVEAGLQVSVFDVEDPIFFLGDFSLESMDDGEELLELYSEELNRIINEEYDAADADVWFQLSVMGEVMFG